MRSYTNFNFIGDKSSGLASAHTVQSIENKSDDNAWYFTAPECNTGDNQGLSCAHNLNDVSSILSKEVASLKLGSTSPQKTHWLTEEPSAGSELPGI